MDSLLCNEVWLMSPNIQEDDGFNSTRLLDCSLFSTKEDCEEAFNIFLGKESRFLPQPGYLKLVMTDDLIRNARFEVVNSIIKTQRRMDLSPETIFMAVNYLDRFVSTNQCQGWKIWMFDLLSVACLSVASKYVETTPHTLHEFQMGCPEKSFAPSLIQRMELMLLKALRWKMNSLTPFSYIDLMIQSINCLDKTLIGDLTRVVTELLLNALLDPKFLQFQPCVMAMSAVRRVLKDIFPSTDDYLLAHLDNIIPHEHKDDLMKCQMMTEKIYSRDSWRSPSSPVTVLIYEYFPVDHCVVERKVRGNGKRKREQVERGL